jgi:hypothetical protein
LLGLAGCGQGGDGAIEGQPGQVPRLLGLVVLGERGPDRADRFQPDRRPRAGPLG